MMRKSRGLTLLETLLVLTIAAAIILVAVRYFSVTHRDLNVTHAIQQVQSLTKASYEWLEAQKQENFSDNNGATAISMQALIDAGLIKNTDRDTKDPWGEAIRLDPGTDPNRVKITMPNVPQYACRNLARRLENVSQIKMPACSSNSNDYSGEF